MTPEWYEPPLPQHPGISNWVHDMRMGYIQPHNDLLPIYDNPNPFAGHDFTEHFAFFRTLSQSVQVIFK